MPALSYILGALAVVLLLIGCHATDTPTQAVSLVACAVLITISRKLHRPS